MRKKIILVYILLCSTTLLIAQKKNNHGIKFLNKKVHGYVISSNNMYLVTDNGLLIVYNNEKTNKQWGDYYKEIYNDSTIINPNRIIGHNNRNIYLNFIIPVNINDWVKQKYSFKDELYLYDFISIDSSGNYSYKKDILGIIVNYKKNDELVLPEHFIK